ncbi:MAG: DNA polymerase [Planctomycetota bacterium]
MTVDPLRQYRQVWACDFEFHAPPGELPEVICMVARDCRSGQLLRLWSDELYGMRETPSPIGPDSLFVAYYASAEVGCFLELGWSVPQRILDLFAEFRCLTNGLPVPCGNGLLGALAYYGLGGADAVEKTEMRDLAIRGGPFTPTEQRALLDYCQSDVDSLVRLLPAMVPGIDLPRALLRGRYMGAVASMERTGTPIDASTLEALREHWTAIKGRLTRRVDQDYGVFVGGGPFKVDHKSAFGQEVHAIAKDIGCHPHYLQEAAKYVHTGRTELVREMQAAERAARRRTGLTLKAIRRWEDAGKDYSTWPQLDVTARELAREYPELGIGRGYFAEDGFDDTDHAALLWDRLREPTDRLPKRDDESILTEAAKQAAEAPAELPDEAPLTFSSERFAAYLVRSGIPWPRLDSGRLALDDDTFREMAKTYPEVAPLRELRHTLGEMRLFEDLAVGADGRNRCLLSPFRTRSGRNAPSNAKFIFGPSCWLRSLIQPETGRAVAYVDWSQQEFGIAAALSGDSAMMDAYASGDPYLRFAIQAGAVPADATKDSHPRERELFKTAALGVNYGMGEQSLAQRIGEPPCVARRLLRLHHETYPQFWKWSQAAVDRAMLHGSLRTIFGWTVHVGQQVNPRSLANYPMQANGAEMLRLASCLAVERGIRVCAPVHDALLVEGPVRAIHEVVSDTQHAMAEASRVVLNGFELRSDAEVVRHPDRYSDKRGKKMWQTVLEILEDLEAETEVGRWSDTPF